MKIFKLNKAADHYGEPIVKLSVSTVLLLGMFFRSLIIPLKDELVQYFFTILTVVFVGPCILVWLLSIFELGYVFHNQKTHRQVIPEDQKTYSKCTTSQLITLINKCDIIEIDIQADDRTIKIGASSDWNHLSGVFFDKQYFIGNTEYMIFDKFVDDLNSLDSNGMLYVISIDGLKPENYNL